VAAVGGALTQHPKASLIHSQELNDTGQGLIPTGQIFFSTFVCPEQNRAAYWSLMVNTVEQAEIVRGY
jgi:hypothetical protein